MSNKINKIFFVIIALLFYMKIIAVEDCNQCFTWQIWPITSDYGPRNEGAWFHRGIDFGGPRNAGIKPVEEGEIINIDFVSSKGWFVDIKSNADNQRIWSFLHIFFGKEKSNVVYSCDCKSGCPNNRDYSYCNKLNSDWELRWAELINPNNENDIINSYIIINWNNNRAHKIFTIQRGAGRYIRNSDGTYVLGENGEKAITQSNVLINIPFAPVGHSGSYKDENGQIHEYPIHLDLRVNNGDDNPLRYMVHTPDINPTVVINNPPDRHIFMRDELLVPYPITITVNSTGGLDLDKVDVWVYKNESENAEDRIHLPVPAPAPFPGGVQNTFQYGGVPGEYKTSNIREFSQNNSSVIPIGNEPGTDKFILYQTFKDLNLPAGKHKLVAIAKDVNDNSSVTTTAKQLSIKNCQL
jgi:hypothetical protein